MESGTITLQSVASAISTSLGSSVSAGLNGVVTLVCITPSPLRRRSNLVLRVAMSLRTDSRSALCCWFILASWLLKYAVQSVVDVAGTEEFGWAACGLGKEEGLAVVEGVEE